jgi:amino acid adenylation domain-containing protein
MSGLEMSLVEYEAHHARFDLSVDLYSLPGQGYRCEFEYSTDLYEEGTIRQLQLHYVRLLEEVLRDPARRIDELPLLSAAERSQILEEWNRTEAPGPGYESVPEWFGAQASLTPDATAVVMGDRSLSYAELDRQSDNVANALLARGVAPGTPVGLYVTRGVEMVVCLLGILKSGVAYLPLDPAYPAQRIEYLLNDSGVELIVTEESLRSSLPQSGAAVLLVEEALTGGDLPGALPKEFRASDLAYLIYTSGSTGEPKGTEVTQGALVNLLASMLREPGLNGSDTLVAVTTLSFDIAALELFGPLVTGAKLVLASREEALSPEALAALLERSGCTVLQATPSTWRMLVESGWMGKPDLRMWCGGEALPAELAESLLVRGRELWNLYGPTETTIWSAVHRVRGGEDPVLIGRPIANTRMYILDSRGEPVPPGVSGELYIAGAGGGVCVRRAHVPDGGSGALPPRWTDPAAGPHR